MGENSAIEWTDHTFNPWVGCQKISPACDHCYAESWAKRAGNPELWNGERRRTTPANWRQPVRWDAAAAANGTRPRVFCASLADVFDNQVPLQWRGDLFRLIYATPNLDWLLLTKRIGNVANALTVLGDEQLPRNVWLGITVANQDEADRDIPKLIQIRAAVRFLSCEPLLGRIDLCQHFGMWWNQTMQCWEGTGAAINRDMWGGKRIDWVIAGGESGPMARPINPMWVHSLRSQCIGAGAAFFFKQWGEWASSAEIGFHGNERAPTQVMAPYVMMRIGKKKAGRSLGGFTYSEWPRSAVQLGDRHA